METELGDTEKEESSGNHLQLKVMVRTQFSVTTNRQDKELKLQYLIIKCLAVWIST
jgi:hypothetical protein